MMQKRHPGGAGPAADGEADEDDVRRNAQDQGALEKYGGVKVRIRGPGVWRGGWRWARPGGSLDLQKAVPALAPQLPHPPATLPSHTAPHHPTTTITKHTQSETTTTTAWQPPGARGVRGGRRDHVAEAAQWRAEDAGGAGSHLRHSGGVHAGRASRTTKFECRFYVRREYVYGLAGSSPEVHPHTPPSHAHHGQACADWAH